MILCVSERLTAIGKQSLFVKLHSHPNRPLNHRSLPEMCNLIFQQSSESLFHFFKALFFFNRHSSDSIRPERRQAMNWPGLICWHHQIKSLPGGNCLLKWQQARWWLWPRKPCCAEQVSQVQDGWGYHSRFEELNQGFVRQQNGSQVKSRWLWKYLKTFPSLYVHVRMRMHVHGRHRYQVSFSIVLHLNFLDRISHWARRLLAGQQGSSVSDSPVLGRTGTHSCTLLFHGGSGGHNPGLADWTVSLPFHHF